MIVIVCFHIYIHVCFVFEKVIIVVFVYFHIRPWKRKIYWPNSFKPRRNSAPRQKRWEQGKHIAAVVVNVVVVVIFCCCCEGDKLNAQKNCLKPKRWEQGKKWLLLWWCGCCHWRPFCCRCYRRVVVVEETLDTVAEGKRDEGER